MVCFNQYELDYLGRIKFLHAKMPDTATIGFGGPINCSFDEAMLG